MLKSLFKQLDAIKERKQYELRINGKSKKYKQLHAEWLQCLHKIGKATE